MGTFVNFTGDMSVPEEEMELLTGICRKSWHWRTHFWSWILMNFPAGTGQIYGRSTAFCFNYLRIVCWRRLIGHPAVANWRQAKSAEENLTCHACGVLYPVSVYLTTVLIWKWTERKLKVIFLLDGSITFWGQVIPNSVPQRRCCRWPPASFKRRGNEFFKQLSGAENSAKTLPDRWWAPLLVTASDEVKLSDENDA